ncbi:MAG: indolepyruvate ferredoxin oxidoreductase subunit alpha [Clostridiales bacterium]|nr:indolepyruvate ferredoxin oxidoreductase subunit alpha [Clostridiales bacterium]
MKKLLLTNQAIAQGAYESGVRVVSSYPGTPSTEITEAVAKYNEVYAEWAPNEKVALEVGIGASIAGARAMVCMKHVGLNVAADPLFTIAYSGVNGGLVIVVADDPGMHSSQNEQDSRFYARSAHIPMVEPADSQEAKDYVGFALDFSEKYDTPVILRTTTRIAHSQSFVEIGERQEYPLRPYVKDVSKYTMMPSSAKGRHIVVEARENKIKEVAETLEINKVIYKDKKLGVICAGAIYQYVEEALPHASIYKLGMVYPLPIQSLKRFASEVDECIVIEELEPFIENQLKANGVNVKGKDIFSLQGEITVATIREKMCGEKAVKGVDAPVRPPIMCAGCPHRGVFYILNKLRCVVNADIGCYTLGAQAPLSSVDTVICMGASVGMAHGFRKANKDAKNVAVIGDSTFIHSGITGLINAVYNKSAMTLIILDNSTTGMTGHQEHPGTGKTLQGDITSKLDLYQICKACGVEKIDVVDPYDLVNVERLVKENMARQEVCVIIAKRECELLKKGAKPYCKVEDCKNCGLCLRIGCPAIAKTDKGVKIDKSLCVGVDCGLCIKVCPFNSIKDAREDN